MTAKRLSIFVVYAVACMAWLPLHKQRAQSDLYLPWRAARAVFLEHRNPYARDLMLESQRIFYGRELSDAESNRDQRRFAYPIYAILPLVPTMGLPFEMADRLMLPILLAISAFGALCWLKAFNVPLGRASSFAWVAAFLISPPVLQGLYLRQLGLLVAGAIAAAAALAIQGKPMLAGVFLAVATIKPQQALFAICIVGIWCGWRLVTGFLGTLALFTLFGQFVSPGWVSQFLWSLREYRNYAGASAAEILFGPRLGLIFAALTLCWLILRVRKSRDLIHALSLALAGQLFIVPGLFALYNAALLAPLALRWLCAHTDIRLIDSSADEDQHLPSALGEAGIRRAQDRG